MNSDINSLTLAYLGDAIYEVYIREYLISKKIVKVNDLQREATKYVSAKGQAGYLQKLISDNVLTDEEVNIVMRARNHKVQHRPKSTDIITYKYATGFEALMGFLYLNNRRQRLDEIMNYIFNIGE